MTTLLQFKFPLNLAVEQFIEQLSNEVDSLLIAKQRRLKTYYDSFDWRLYSNDIICEFDSTKLTLKTVKSNRVIAHTKLNKVPRFTEMFDHKQIRQQLEPILEMRALLPICTVPYQSYQFNIVNTDKKIILHLVIEEYPQLKPRVFLQTLKGYDAEAGIIIHLLTAQLGLTITNKPILLAVLKQQGLPISHYSPKLIIPLNPDMQADLASKLIYSQLLSTIKANEHGTIANIDSEFLHDFRVAVRKTRSALSQLKKVFPHHINVHYSQFFSWLGKETSVTRDLDVYLLNFDRYKSSLPIEMREHLNPLRDFLHGKQRQAQQELAEKLQSTHYLSTLSNWDQFLNDPISPDSTGANAECRIKQLADKRLWKCYQRVLHKGKAITEHSPGDALHELRKSCKKLRYLIEFFQSLYSKNKIKILLKSLKQLQEVLGDYQDCEVQECNLKLFSAEMQKMNLAKDTFLAINQLIENLILHKREIRSRFSLTFSAFKQEEFKDLLK